MIYLIDDKKLRQEKDYKWSFNRFQKYDELIKPVYTLNEPINDEIFKEGNIILYHESFIDITYIKDNKSERLQSLQGFAKKKNSYLVLFSGSKNTREISGNIANIPVSVLYNNLEAFIKRMAMGEINLRYLLFGDNPDIEENLSEKLRIELFKTTQESTYACTSKNLFIRPDEKYINQPLSHYTERTFFDNVTDKDFSEAIVQWLNEDVFDNIFIPLCFGNTLSDYNGLRLACHIRCTKTKNQTSRIFIYGFVGLEYLLENEYFNIIKTKNTFLIPFSKQAFAESVQKPLSILLIDELHIELSKLKLDKPQNYEDNHSITNEWAIHQWAKTIGCDETDELAKVFKNVEANLYFKYLRTINPISELDRISSEELKFNCKGKPKVLLIDDEADKGWYEIFAYLLGDLNGIYTDYLGIDFKNLSSDDIIEKSIDKIFTDDIDIVILDFRLNPSDFENKNSEHITSVALLKKIKERNPGIQVIAFSATNKIWNLQSLQNAGVDGFIFKDGSENINKTISSLIVKIKVCYEKASLLKPMYISFNTLKHNVLKLSETFKNNIDKNLSICFELLEKSFHTSKYRNYAYLQLFLIVEEYIKEESVFEYGSNCYVISPTSRYLVLSKIDPTKKNSPAHSAIKFIKANGHYHLEHSMYDRSVDTNFVMSAILLFRYGLPTSGGENWSRIYKIRNKKAAHPEVGIVEYSEINLLAQFLGFILDESNINNVEPNKALKELSPEEQVQNLKKIWGAK